MRYLHKYLYINNQFTIKKEVLLESCEQMYFSERLFSIIKRLDYIIVCNNENFFTIVKLLTFDNKINYLCCNSLKKCTKKTIQ